MPSDKVPEETVSELRDRMISMRTGGQVCRTEMTLRAARWVRHAAAAETRLIRSSFTQLRTCHKPGYSVIPTS